MKCNYYKTALALIICTAIVFVVGCGKDDGGKTPSDPTVITTIPTVITSSVSDISSTTAICGGNITSENGSSVTARGVCWSTSEEPTIADSKTTDGTGSGIFTSNITDLTPETTYYVRAYATNEKGTGYGQSVTFTTIQEESITVIDADGNEYQTVTIGSQKWMAENLKTTKYNDGTSIPNISENAAWDGLTTGAFCTYFNDAVNKSIYGNLYNWFAVETGKLCPTGWHVPSDAEWNTLTDYLSTHGFDGTQGKALKDQQGWYNNGNGTDDYGFTAKPGGSRQNAGFFANIVSNGYWWTSTSDNAYDVSVKNISFDKDVVSTYTYYKKYGFSIRCIRNN